MYKHDVMVYCLCLVALGATPGAHAQRNDGPARAADAISDAVQEGHSPYRQSAPDDEPHTTRNLNSPECRELLEQFNSTPERAYQHSGAPITTSQGRVVRGLERDPARDNLIDTFRAKCTH
jgi:hypothetical protein